MTVPRQLPLDLGHRTALGREDFLVAAANAEAVAWVDRWPDWPGFALALHGPAGCGKSHLAQVFAARAGAAGLGAVVIGPAEVVATAPPRLLAEHRAIVVDDADRCIDETALFHLWNAVREAGGWLLLTGEAAPARWGVRLPDLASRLATAQAVAIAAPDDALLQAVLVKLFADRQLAVPPEVLAYLLRHMERSFAAAGLVVEVADQLAMAERKGITVPLIRRALESQDGEGEGLS